ncbi:proliferation marker protein Ki-67 isoform X1 [Eleginops maclovinus]|uniref:proliferation marker protein Ki-67 isoform X1 n=2 Tax=Eleginops maclovinus TaxID=56733 RepID=UPI003080E4A8
MPLHGKIVVIKRSGGDGTEFPLTATCLFGRMPDCDIRIQLPQVSKEHCRIDLNENKEVVLTNLSTVNPTRVNGEALQQSERLKNGDVITIIDRSFRFEYPPAPTPKKRTSRGGQSETLKVLQAGDKVSTETAGKRIPEVSTDPHLKDGANHDNIQRSLDKNMEVESKQDESLLQNKTTSPFGDLYQMIKQSLDVKTPRKSSASVLQTPTSRFCTPKPVSVKKNDSKPVISTEDKSIAKKGEVSAVAEETKEAEHVCYVTPKSAKKNRRSFQTPSTEMAAPKVEASENAATSEDTTPLKRVRTPPQRFICEQSPVRRRSKETTPAVTKEQEEQAVTSPKVNSKKRKIGEVSDSPSSQMKRKRVSFGGTLCPELFDKRLPPDSPLRKGATPRRSLCVTKTKQSLLRRASVIGLLAEHDQENSPARRKTPSPKRSSSPKNASPKTPTPAKKSPKPRTPSPAKGKSSSVGGTPAVLPPSVQGRFSVSRIITPSPVAENVVTDLVPSVSVTPKITQRRKSTSRESTAIMRRSGISRASMKIKNSWADIVRFGPTKPQVVAAAKKTVTKKTTKTAVPQPQTPAKTLMGHVSTGHADSPITIVVGRAQQRVVPSGAAPRLVPNIAILKKNMKMDEDLTGISEMLKTPAVERKKKSVINENNVPKTPLGALGTSVVEPSVLNTPEETGEMMVSPLTVSSSVKDRRYNSEAVQRLLNDEEEEASLVSEVPASENPSDDSSEQQSTDLKTTAATTPKQKPEVRECLTGVKRIMKTPKQKCEPIEDLRGKILKTPKQKREQQKECLTGVKRMMATPKQEAVEHIKVELLTTPKQKTVRDAEIVCETPQQEAGPVNHLQEKVLETPKAPEATSVEEIASDEAPAEDSQGPEEIMEEETAEYICVEVKETEVAASEAVVDALLSEVSIEHKDIESSDAAEPISEAPVEESVAVEEPKIETVAVNESEEAEVVTVDEMVTVEEPKVEDAVAEEPEVNAVDKTSEEQPKEDAVEVVSEEEPKVDTVEETASEEKPKVETASEEVTEMDTTSSKPHQKKKSVRGKKTKTVEPETAEDQQEAAAEELKVDTVEEIASEEEPKVETASEEVTEMDTTSSKPHQKKKSVRGKKTKTVEPEAAEDQQEAAAEEPKVDTVEEIASEEPKVETASEEVTEMDTTSSKPHQKKKSVRGKKTKTVEPETAEDQQEAAAEELKVDTVEEIASEEPKVETASEEVTEMDTTSSKPDQKKKSVRGRRTKTMEPEAAEDQQEAAEQSEEPVVPTPAKGRRGKKTEAAAPPAVKQTRGRNAKSQESQDVELPVEKDAPKPKRGRAVKKAEVVPEVETEMVPEPESEPSTPVEVEQEANESTAPVEKAVQKPKRGRKTKQQDDAVKEAEDQQEATPVIESLPEEEAATCEIPEEEEAAIVQKKPVRSRRAKVVESKSANDQEEAAEQEAVVAAPVRGRRGKKTEAVEPPVRKSTTRGRNAKSQESTADEQPEVVAEKVEETVAEVSTEAESKQTSPIEEITSAPPAEEAVVKPVRGRKTKLTPVEPENNKGVRRGKKTKTDAVEENEVVEVAVETKQHSQPPVKARRGRNAKQEEEEEKNLETVETTKTQEPAKKMRRSRKAVQEIETVVPEEAEATVVVDEPVKMEEHATVVAAKPKRGGRKAKPEPEIETPVEPAEVQEVSIVSTTNKLKRGRKGKQATEEVAGRCCRT